MKLEFDIEFTEAQAQLIKDGNYLIWVTTQNHLFKFEDSDKVAVKIDSQDYDIITDNSSVLRFRK